MIICSMKTEYFNKMMKSVEPIASKDERCKWAEYVKVEFHTSVSERFIRLTSTNTCAISILSRCVSVDANYVGYIPQDFKLPRRNNVIISYVEDTKELEFKCNKVSYRIPQKDSFVWPFNVGSYVDKREDLPEKAHVCLDIGELQKVVSCLKARCNLEYNTSGVVLSIPSDPLQSVSFFADSAEGKNSPIYLMPRRRNNF